jgi:hypothetical protein
VNIVEAMNDRELFGRFFKDPKTWTAWRAVLKAIFGLKTTKTEAALIKRLSGRRPPRQQVREAWIAAGRRSGKTWIASLICCYIAAFMNWRQGLQSGERAVVLLLAVDRAKAAVAFRYIRAAFREVPMLRALVERETADTIELSTGAAIQVSSSSFRRVRGRTIVAAVLDECAYWHSLESATPAEELYSAILPAMATVEGSLLIGISSPYRQSGLLFEKFRAHHGEDGDVLALRAETRELNPTISEKVIQRAMERDPVAGASEWLATWRSDLQVLLSPEMIEAAVDRARPPELPPVSELKGQYKCFADPSGGRRDSFGIAIGHREGDLVIVDVARAAPAPFDPQKVTAEFAELARAYGCYEILGDKYGGSWPETAFRECSMIYKPAAEPKSALYLECLPLFARGVIRFAEDKRLIAELQGLERRTSRSGKDAVDHGVGQHDDLANAVCGLCWMLGSSPVWDVSEEDFWVEEGTVAGQLAALASRGVVGRDAMLAIGSPATPWSTTSRLPSGQSGQAH